MTDEEARRILIQNTESLKANPLVTVDDCLYEAFDIAIKALEQNDDCVSRKSIVDKIHALQAELTSNDDSKWNRNKLAFKYMAYVNGIILNEPSVQSERPKGKWIEYKVDIAPHPLHCSLCSFSNHHISNRYMKEFRRCPNCGAEMSGDEEDDDNINH